MTWTDPGTGEIVEAAELRRRVAAGEVRVWSREWLFGVPWTTPDYVRAMGRA